MMASYDRTAFAFAVAAALEKRGLSGEAAARAFPDTDTRLWSWVRNGKEISVGNFLLVCRVLELWPLRYLVREKRLTKKSVLCKALTRAVSRETET